MNREQPILGRLAILRALARRLACTAGFEEIYELSGEHRWQPVGRRRGGRRPGDNAINSYARTGFGDAALGDGRDTRTERAGQLRRGPGVTPGAGPAIVRAVTRGPGLTG